MTFKHKLSRRLAIARDVALVSVLALLIACSDEATGPDTGLPQFNDVAKVVPAKVTIETNQKIRFRTETAHGKVVATTLTWKSSGGSITTDGVFSASAPGTYKVVGRGRGRQKGDTSTVVVVPPPGDIIGIKVLPGDASVDVRASKTFSASALLADGTTSAVGVNWSATGGTISSSGLYTACNTAGSYRVIAAASGLADTASLTLTAPAPAPDPTPTPTSGSGATGLPFGLSQQLTKWGALQAP